MLKRIKKTVMDFTMGFVLPPITMIGFCFGAFSDIGLLGVFGNLFGVISVALFIGGTITLIWFLGPLAPVIVLGGISTISGLIMVWNGWSKKK